VTARFNICNPNGFYYFCSLTLYDAKKNYFAANHAKGAKTTKLKALFVHR